MCYYILTKIVKDKTSLSEALESKERGNENELFHGYMSKLCLNRESKKDGSSKPKCAKEHIKKRTGK